MISKTIGFRGFLYFQTHPYSTKIAPTMNQRGIWPPRTYGFGISLCPQPPMTSRNFCRRNVQDVHGEPGQYSGCLQLRLQPPVMSLSPITNPMVNHAQLGFTIGYTSRFFRCLPDPFMLGLWDGSLVVASPVHIKHSRESMMNVGDKK